jgi:hypothetical protein
MDLPRFRAARIVLPLGVARQLVDHARREWGVHAERELDADRTMVSFYLGGASQNRDARTLRSPGAIYIRWGVPTPSSALIERIGWDPALGGSEAEVRHVIDALVGWPVRELASSPAVDLQLKKTSLTSRTRFTD